MVERTQDQTMSIRDSMLYQQQDSEEESLITWRQGKAFCGNCGLRIPTKIKARYCHKCGRKIRWHNGSND